MSIPVRYWMPALIAGAVVTALLMRSPHDGGTLAAAAPTPAMAAEPPVSTPPQSTPEVVLHESSGPAPAPRTMVPAASTAVSLTPVLQASQSTIPLPLDIETRPSEDHPGRHRVTLHSSSEEPLNINVTLSSRDAEKNLQQVVTLKVGTDLVLGGDDGWPIEAGDTIVLSSSGYADRSIPVE